MFVDITNEKKPLKAEALYNKCYRGNEEITPKIATEVLRSTNYATCMKRMLTCVGRLSLEKQAEFKEVVLSVFHNREQPADVLVLGKKLAAAGGYEGELGKIAGRFDVKCGGYILSSPMLLKCDMADYRRHNGKEFARSAGVVFTGLHAEVEEAERVPAFFDVSQCKIVAFKKVNLAGVKNLKLSNCTSLSFNGVENIPDDLDVKPCYRASFLYCDLSGAEELRFRDKARISFENTALPETLDVSPCGFVKFRAVNMAEIKSLKFGENAEVFFRDVANLPADMDFLRCKEVEFRDCDLRGIKIFKFNENTSVSFRGGCRFPEVLDLSALNMVELSECNLEGVREIKFKKGAHVNLNQTINLPEELDFSKCREVLLYAADLSSVKTIKFADKTQKEGAFGALDSYAELNVVYGNDLFSNIADVWRGFKQRR